MTQAPNSLDSPFHAGERAVQARAEVPATIEAIAKQMIRDSMPDQHRDFFARLPFVVLGTVDHEGQPWATILAGAPGFLHSPDPRRLIVDALPKAPDPAAPLLMGCLVGLLGIEPHTRRRNRLNGRITAHSHDSFELTVVQSFGNCPKYIQAREASYIGDEAVQTVDAVRKSELDADTTRLIRTADTFFVASTHPSGGTSQTRAEGVDVSHRGGKSGFVQVTDSRTLIVPDFAGNRLFNTLGNLTLLNLSVNREAQNFAFTNKRDLLIANTNLRLNIPLISLQVWDEEGIVNRGEFLADAAVKVR